MSKLLLAHLRSGSVGKRPGICSVCSSHPWVIRAAAEQARESEAPLLIEATSNQVNQFGGYTGMRPKAFRAFVLEQLRASGFDESRLILGGDHLGPNPWRALPAAEAMDHAEAMVSQYVSAGFTKIHLDASMMCGDDKAPLDDSTVAERAARLCRVAEAASFEHEPPVYVIGTEVPVPGGAAHAVNELAATSVAAASQTLAVHREIFMKQVPGAWERVIALVVQPGVEFDHHAVIDYDPTKAVELRDWLRAQPEPILFEAHSTDYQRPQAYRQLVADGFAILKVGPALTFAMREALDALESIESELIAPPGRSTLRATLEATMLGEPRDWQPYYKGSVEEMRLLRHYSYSDRVRYYWGKPAVADAVRKLIANLNAVHIPEGMLSRHLPAQYQKCRNHALNPDPESLIVDKVRDVLRVYMAA